MHSVLWLRIRALAGGRIEIANPELPVGESVDVPVRRPSDLPHRSAVDILEEVAGSAPIQDSCGCRVISERRKGVMGALTISRGGPVNLDVI